MVYSLLIIWILYAIIEGKREAIFWHHRIRSSDYEIFKSKDRHMLFTIQRGLVLLLISITIFYICESIWLTLYLFIMNALIFSFFHNGMMYRERNQMTKITHPNNSDKWVYRYGWLDQSTTSTAKLTKIMTPANRTIQMIMGVVGYITYHFL